MLLTSAHLSVSLQALEEHQYQLVVPLAVMFSSTLLQVRMTSLSDEVLPFNRILTTRLSCTAVCRRHTVLLAQNCWKKQKRCSAAFSPGLNLLAVCVETSSPHYTWSKKPQVSVCVRVCVVLFLALVCPLVAHWKHAVIILAGQTPSRQQEEQNAVAFDPKFNSKDMGKFS